MRVSVFKNFKIWRWIGFLFFRIKISRSVRCSALAPVFQIRLGNRAINQQTDPHAAWTDPDVGGATEHRIGYGAGANANKQQAKLTPSPQPNRGRSPPTPCHRNHRYPTLISRLVDRDAFLVFLNFRIWRRIGFLFSRIKKPSGGEGGV